MRALKNTGIIFLLLLLANCGRKNKPVEGVKYYAYNEDSDQPKKYLIVFRKQQVIDNRNCFTDFTMKYASNGAYDFNFRKQTYYKTTDTLYYVLRKEGAGYIYMPYLCLTDTGTVINKNKQGISENEWYYLMFQSGETTKLVRKTVNSSTFLVMPEYIDGVPHYIELDTSLSLICIRPDKKYLYFTGTELIPNDSCPMPRSIVMKFINYCTINRLP